MLFRPFADFLCRLRQSFGRTKRIANRVPLCERLEERVLLSIDAVQVSDIVAGATGSSPSQLTNVNGTLYFSSNDGITGKELWKSDGTAAGTVLVKDIAAGSVGSNPGSLTNVNGTLYFTANDGTSGVELWKSDGTAAGTVPVKDLAAGSASSFPSSLLAVNGMLFFTADDGVTGQELWKSDGTDAGTIQLMDIKAGSLGSYPSSLTAVNNTLFFTADDGITGKELWKSDGTAAGTIQVKDIKPGQNGSFPNSLTNVGGTLFFTAASSPGNYQLWKTDGTVSGTIPVKTIGGGAGSYSISYLTDVSGTLYFGALDATNHNELWKSDGTAAGTVQIKTFGVVGYYPQPLTGLTNINGTLFFSGNATTGDFELWKSDGTTAGTVLVKDIAVGATGSYPSSLTNLSGTLYFTANDGIAGKELWKSNGTAAGTTLVKDINLGSNASSPGSLTNVNGSLYFSADDGTSGIELWHTVVTNVNDPPTDLSLSATSIAENNAANATVGTLSGFDPDSGDTLTYSLVDGTGSTDNASFSIVGNTLQIIPVTHFATQSSYSIRVQVADQGGLTFQKQFTINVIKANQSPTDITLSSTSIAENNAANAAVGTFGATDPDTGNTFTFSLVAGTGGTDNSSFTIVGNSLQITPSTNFEAKSSYSILVQVADQGGLTFQKQFTINVTNVNEAPTNVGLSATSLTENNAANATVGTFTATDPDASNTFTFSLVAGTGSTDNASFSIVGNTLKIIPVTNFATKNSYSVRVRVTDQGGLTFEKQFTISITKADLAPTNLTLSSNTLAENNAPNAAVGTLSSTDPDVGDTFTYSLVAGTGSTDNGSFSIAGNALQIIPVADFESKTSYSIRIRTTDQLGMSFEKQFTISITNVDDFPTVITLNSEPLVYHVAARKVVAVDGTATISDGDATALNFTGSVLQVSGQTSKDKLSILKQEGITTKGKNVLLGKTVIGTIAGGTKGSALTIHLTSAATQPVVQSLMRSIGFKSTDKVAANRTLKFQVTNISGTNTNQATRQIQVEH